MFSSLHHQFYLVSIVIELLLGIILLLHSSQVSCFSQQHQPLPPGASPQGLIFEDKTRLGSTPPSCHNKCNGCHPCMAVQVPTIPSHDRVEPGFPKSTTTEFLFDPYPSGNRYSNYKPLGWKCHCDGHFYNP